MKVVKTNAIRMLDKQKITYEIMQYPLKGNEPAVDVPTYLGFTRNDLFKTLVTTDTNHHYFVFCIQSSQELDLKKAASVAGVKRIEMIKQKDLLPLTGYIHGGCTPIGMKKHFDTFIDEACQSKEEIIVSAGKVGMLIKLKKDDLIQASNATIAALIK